MKRIIIVLSALALIGCKAEKICACTREYNPVCAGNNQYANPCLAKCDGYTDSEISVLLRQEEIDTGILISVDCSS